MGDRVKKSLGVLDVFSIATGAMIGSGFFLLPGIAFARAGPAVVLSYLLAAVLMIPTLFSKAELATAMPRAGGTYFFVSRSLGPIFGVFDGFGAWLSMVAKSAFALVGIGFYLSIFVEGWDAWFVARVVAIATAVVLGAVNAYGTRETGFFQTVLVVGLVGLSVYFIGHGSFSIDATRLLPFAPNGLKAILATSGLVFVSYAGLTKVASVSEEVSNPEKTIPRGMFLSLAVATLIYVLGVFVTVGLLPAETLRNNYTPLATAAKVFAGKFGMWAMATAGIFAFVTTANAGVMSASRYLFAMGRDNVLPRKFGRLSGRSTPLAGVALSTAAIIAIVLFLDAEGIAKLASTFQLLIFASVNLSVIVMRESRVRSYDPGFRSPGYPWVQLAGVLVSLVLVPLMGWMPVAFALGLMAVGLVWYVLYAHGRVEHAVAVMHVLERLAEQILSREAAGPALDRELREIMKEKGLRPHDPFVELVERARIMDLPEGSEWDDIMREAVEHFSSEYPSHAEEIRMGLLELARGGEPPAADGIALPHLRLDAVERYELIIARSRRGLHFPGVEKPVNAVFVLLGSKSDPQQHLRILAGIARRAEEPDFLTSWAAIEETEDLRKMLLAEPRR